VSREPSGLTTAAGLPASPAAGPAERSGVPGEGAEATTGATVHTGPLPAQDTLLPPSPLLEPVELFDGDASPSPEQPAQTPLLGVRRPKERRRARRVTRVIRRIDLWSVLKLALVLYTCMYAATLAALVTIWAAAYSTGLVDKLQSFLGDVGLDNFRFYGDQMFRACAAIGAVLVLAGTLITVLTVALINLVSELTGGIRMVIIEEEPWPDAGQRVAVAEVEPLPSGPAAGL
jgi:hypothetical protein